MSHSASSRVIPTRDTSPGFVMIMTDFGFSHLILVLPMRPRVNHNACVPVPAHTDFLCDLTHDTGRVGQAFRGIVLGMPPVLPVWERLCLRRQAMVQSWLLRLQLRPSGHDVLKEVSPSIGHQGKRYKRRKRKETREAGRKSGRKERV